MTLYKKYNATDYPKYDNYDAINIDKVNEIPEDYDGAMGVPITFLDKYNPEQFEIIRFRKGNDNKDLIYKNANNETVQPYFRIIIKKKMNRTCFCGIISNGLLYTKEFYIDGRQQKCTYIKKC